jgi:signal peptidase I
MTLPYETKLRSPLISVWLKPRYTIERIIATQPGRGILLLASCGGLSSIAGQLIDFGFASELLDWRVFFGAALVGSLIGVANLYVVAFLAAWIGRKMGSRAPASELRNVFAWSLTPAILGLGVVLSIIAGTHALGREATVASRSFSVLLQALLGVCSLWSIIVALLMLSRIQHLGFWRTFAVYLICAFLLPFLVAFGIRTLLFQPFSIPSDAMNPTLLAGDYLFVSKFSYGYSRYSLPFVPSAFPPGRILATDPRPGDVVVFALPKDKATTYIKRVIGLAGDRIQMKEGLLHINGKAVARERLPDYTGNEPCGPSITAVKRWRETLPNGISHETLDCVDSGFFDNTAEYTVPPGHIFVMGDNRDNSTDSRVQSAVGYIPLENIFGRAEMIYFSRTHLSDGAASVRFERVGIMVR